MTVTDHSGATLEGAHGHGLGAVVPNRSRAERIASFDVADFPMPTGREEEWRFTPLDRLGALLDDVPAENLPVWNLDALRPGVTITEVPPAEVHRRTVRAPSDRCSAISALRTLRVLGLSVAPGAVVDRPIDIGILFAGGTMRSHFVLEVGEDAKVTVIARYTGTAEVSEFLSLDIASRAHLTLVLIDETSTETVHLSDLVFRLGADAKLQCLFATFGAGVARRNTTVVMDGEGGEVDLYGLYFAGEGQHIENRVFIDHVAPRCRSRVAFKGAVAGETARAVWIGDVLIRAEAEGTDTYELNRNLLLTEGARADSVPNLEIQTGEIQGAGHASATGRFDDEQVFYLQSRGIAEDEARRMIVHGFFADLAGKIGIPRVEKDIMRSIDGKLGGHR